MLPPGQPPETQPPRVEPPRNKPTSRAGRFSLRELLIGVLMLAMTMGGLRFSIFADAEDTVLIHFTLVAAGLGGLVGLLARWNPWLMCLLGIAVLWVPVGVYKLLEWAESIRKTTMY